MYLLSSCLNPTITYSHSYIFIYVICIHLHICDNFYIFLKIAPTQSPRSATVSILFFFNLCVFLTYHMFTFSLFHTPIHSKIGTTFNIFHNEKSYIIHTSIFDNTSTTFFFLTLSIIISTILSYTFSLLSLFCKEIIKFQFLKRKSSSSLVSRTT